MKSAGCLVSLVISLSCVCLAGADRPMKVDEAGVLRWADDGGEVALVGVNYYTPFTIDYAEVKRLGIDHKQVIRDDVAHFRRLGFGCIRVHCFERQFSDADGNLLDNTHVDLLDFLIDECRRNGLYTVLTPIAWWGGGKWTDRTHGFSDVYEMRKMTTDRTAWTIQARFLKQFAEHVNRYTGRKYAEDPCVLAFECINEPLYPKDTPDSLVTEYINTLSDGLRAGGTVKPIYYNSWQGRNKAAAAARIEGVTCSYYPTGLVAGHALEGPQLIRIRASSLHPDEAIVHKSRMAYEFDAADVAGSYMYPVMAKLFRFEGVQVAAQFQYDPMVLANVNQNWQTHHLNLIYTPGKALALAIAAEVFARIPRGTPYDPANHALVFEPFRVSADEDLSEMVTRDRFIYSNTTRTQPPAAAALERVWGCGSSPVAVYDGTGAYFLDRVSAGVWRLQIYPDAFTLADPYTGTAEPKVRVIPGRHDMTLLLPDLGGGFSVWPFDGRAAGERRAVARGGAFTAEPGDYLLTVAERVPEEALLHQPAGVPRYVAPSPEAITAPLLCAAVSKQWRAGVPLELRAQAAFATNVTARLISDTGDVREVTLTPVVAPGCAPFRYEGLLPGEALKAGSYRVAFKAEGPAGVTVYPEGKTFDVRWLTTSGPAVPLYSVPPRADAADGIAVSKNNARTAEVAIVEGRVSGSRALRLVVDGCDQAGQAAGYSLPFMVNDTGKQRLRTVSAADSETGWGLRVVARGGDGNGTRVELGFKMKNGQGLGYDFRVGSAWSASVLPVTELHPLWGLPSRAAFRWQDVERISVLTGPWLWRNEKIGRQVFDLAELQWVELSPSFALTVAEGSTPWELVDVKALLRTVDWTHQMRRWQVWDCEGRQAAHLGTDGFSAERESVSLRMPCEGKAFAKLWQTDGQNAVLTVRARAACPKTTGFELALIESGDVAWGMVVPLTVEWRTIRIPGNTLKLFTQWDKTMTARAGKQVRLSRLETVNLCFGKWLFKDAAAEPHAFEIAGIGIAAAPHSER